MPLKPFILSLSPALLALAILSCGGNSKNNPDPGPGPGPTPTRKVFAVGWNESENIDNVHSASFWEDGDGLGFGDSGLYYSAKALSGFVSGDTLYAAGWERYRFYPYNTYPLFFKANYQATFVERTFQRLNTGNYSDAIATSVYVSGSDVYIAGDGLDSQSISTVLLWKNGALTAWQPSSPYRHGYSSSCFVLGNDTYIAGCEYDNTGGAAVLWKNGVPQQISSVGYRDGYYMAYNAATSVYVSGNDVYVAGYELNGRNNFVATLWKNSAPQRLSSDNYNAEALSVFVSGNDVYVAGWEENAQGRAVAKIWKNGALLQSLSNGSYDAYATSVYVIDGDVYASGYELNQQGIAKARVWKNGASQYSSLGGSREVVAHSIFVK